MAIPEFFRDQTIFVTGGTGFIGKVLIEKLLRSCPDIKRIYLAIRPKKGADIHQRWAELSQRPLFDLLKKERPKAMEKVYLISADMKKANLGLSEQDKETLINEVNIVYHGAATVQFVETVVETVTQNARSTFALLELCKVMKNHKVLVYISTAYSNFYRPESEWDEKIYPAVHDWKVVLKLLEREPMTLALLQEKLLCGHPNPYTYSKSLAEDIVNAYSHELLTCIVRPSVVMSTYREPIAGWVDSLNGVMSLCVAFCLGIIRVAWYSKGAHHDHVSVDFLAKNLIAATWATYIDNLKGKKTPTPVYNCTSGNHFIMSPVDMLKVIEEKGIVETTPSKYIVWTRNPWFIENAFLYYTIFYIYQLLPACILDAAIYLYGEKPQFVSIAKKLTICGTRIFKAYTFRCIRFPNSNSFHLFKRIEKEDMADFYFPESSPNVKVDLNKTVEDGYLGLLKYTLKEDLSKEAIERNKKRYMRIIMLSKTLNVVSYSLFAWLLYRILVQLTNLS